MKMSLGKVEVDSHTDLCEVKKVTLLDSWTYMYPDDVILYIDLLYKFHKFEIKSFLKITVH